MRIPEKPPPWDLKRSLRVLERAVKFLPAVPPADQQYLHWDILRHRPPPEGLSHEDWWFLLKQSRLASRRRFPLKDKKGRDFSFTLPDAVQEILHLIDQNASGLIVMPEELTDPGSRDRYIARSLIEESFRSSQLEGAVTTRKAAKEMIQAGRAPQTHGEKMVLNNYRTMERVRELREEKLSPEIVLDLHRMITLDTLTDPKDYGRLRTSDENIFVADVEGKIIHTPPAADELEARLKAMCSFANGESPAGFLHPVVRAIALHFWLAYDHPFVDGNGRTARALFYWCMLNKGYWLCEFLSISSVIYKAPQQYYRAFLYTETDDNDLSYFILYHLEKISEALDELRKYLERSAQRLRQLDSLLHGSDEFNHRQRDLLRHALRHPGAVYYIRRHQRSHKVVYQTARADLLELAERHLLRKVKKGRAYGFIPMPRLEARLAALGTGTAGAPRKRL